MGRGITIVDVIKELGLEPSSDLTWGVGSRVRVMWEDEYGALPQKELRTKTGGGGSHCFAVYPSVWRDKIAAVVRQFETEASRQADLFK